MLVLEIESNSLAAVCCVRAGCHRADYLCYVQMLFAENCRILPGYFREEEDKCSRISWLKFGDQCTPKPRERQASLAGMGRVL
jgi:hypothetical protein